MFPTISTSIQNDGKTLSVTIRGVEFRDGDFDILEPSIEPRPLRLASFTLQNDALCSCVIEFEIPVPVATPGGTSKSVLSTRLELGDTTPNGGIDREHLSVRLRSEGMDLSSRAWSGWFEDELLDIQRQMTEGIDLRACINCAFSDYSPVGHGLFGGLACFRDNKEGYRTVKTKNDLFRVWGTMTEFVQETYRCPEFERRSPDTGYRG
jgi:Family of unknown function (DUF6304)